jgi:hypothetical protein
MNDTRIVLVKPGDVLMLGNVTLPEDEDAVEAFNTALGTLRKTLGLEHVLVFEDDIDLAVKPGGWYDHGGVMPCGVEAVRNDTGKREPLDTGMQIQSDLDYIRGRFGKGT